MASFARSRRFLELVQLVLALASVTAVADASRAAAQHEFRPSAGQYARSSGEHERTADRRFSDLVRFERKRREAAQRRSRHGLMLSVQARRRTPAPGRHETPAE